jgi:hypothetical protein
MEEEGEADPFALRLDEQRFGVFARSEQALAQVLLRRRDLALELLELRQLSDEAEDVGDVGDARFDNPRPVHGRTPSRLNSPRPARRLRAPSGEPHIASRRRRRVTLTSARAKGEERRRLPGDVRRFECALFPFLAPARRCR